MQEFEILDYLADMHSAEEIAIRCDLDATASDHLDAMMLIMLRLN